MFGSDFYGSDLWWMFPIIMMVLCLFMMFGHRGSMMCGPHSRDAGSHHRRDASDPGSDIPDKQHTQDEISREGMKRK